jgi:hypothetical protein
LKLIIGVPWVCFSLTAVQNKLLPLISELKTKALVAGK